MREIVARGLSGLLFTAAACSLAQVVPSDFAFKTLDPASAVHSAELILLAVPTARHHEGTMTVVLPGRAETCELIETETTLRVEAVLKGGPAGPEGTAFTHYDVSGYKILMGPPGGPSGPVGERGIFFLRRRSDGTIRAAVDVYRPDIPTPWIEAPIAAGPCSSVPDCIAALLLTFHDRDDAESFSARLLENVAISRQLVGFFQTFRLLDNLVNDARLPYLVRHGACAEQAKWYALELPSTCRALVAGTALEHDYLAVAGKLRDGLRLGGLAWVQRRIGSDSDAEVKRYLELLVNGPDDEARASAKNLLGRLR